MPRSSADWLDRHKTRETIEVFYLPSYSPELNPDEYLNGDLKTGGAWRHSPADPRRRSSSMFLGHMRMLQRLPGPNESGTRQI